MSPPGAMDPPASAAAAAHETRLRVRYAEVDRMGFAHHSSYLVWFEEARTEFLRSLGASYLAIEETGTLLVVAETGIRFLKPAHYEDEIVIRTRVLDTRGVRLRFEYEIVRGRHTLATGWTLLVTCDTRGRPKRPPAELHALLGAGGRKTRPAGGVEEAANRGTP